MIAARRRKASSALTLEADGKVNILTGMPDVGRYYTVSQQMVWRHSGCRRRGIGVVFKDADSPARSRHGRQQTDEYVRSPSKIS
jgi:hypothetical protein